MLGSILPPVLDHRYHGSRAAPWLLGVIVVMKSAQSLTSIFLGELTARGADGIPLDAFPPDASAAVVAVAAQGAIWRLCVCAVGALVLARYRSGIPLMFVLFALNHVAAQGVLRVVPLNRVGAPVGPQVNLALFAMMIIGLLLSLRRRRD